MSGASPRRSARVRALGVQAVLAFLLAGCSSALQALPAGSLSPLRGDLASPASHAGAEICGNRSLLTGPSKPPKGAVVVPAGDNSSLTPRANATYWFASGTHTFGNGPYGQIIAAAGDVFIGGPNAVLDGRLKNQYAFTQAVSDVTVEYLTIRRFGAIGSNEGQGVVNHSSGRKWLIQYNTVIDDAGAGVFLGPESTTRFNCLSHNGEYGFSSYAPHGDSHIVLDHNEIVANNTYNWEKHVYGCGCSGGGKFWDTNGATVTNNWVRNNRGPALWADTDDNNFDFENNDIEDNTGEGIIVEISYNAQIEKNTFVRNALVDGPKNPGFPTGAVYLSESGGDSRVPARYSTISVENNTFVDNWSGVVLFENADRFCGSPANGSSGFCTLVDPHIVNLKTCVAGKIRQEPYYSDCRWKTQNVSVSANLFKFDPAHISGCTPSASCGLQGLFSNWGTYPSWSPYKKAVIEQAITFHQNDVFSNNTYVGPWEFMAHDQSRVLTFRAWQRAPYRQDRGSTYN
jgi:parallel beta-helix repeat protein